MHSADQFLTALRLNTPSVEAVLLPEFGGNGIQAHCLRLDRLHPVVSGNKYFKLKYHLRNATEAGCTTICTFGGPWSNHIIATAVACRDTGLKSMAFIRGEEPAEYSQTLREAKEAGMDLIFLSRQEYAARCTVSGINGTGIYFLPAGGAGASGVNGSAEILDFVVREDFTHILCSIGTGTMATGITISAHPHQLVIAVPALKGYYSLENEYVGMLEAAGKTDQVRIIPDFHFGGYAKSTPELFDFMNRLFYQTGIPTDFVYTGKLFFAASQLAREQYFDTGSRLLIIHSGGLQGNNSLPNGVLDF